MKKILFITILLLLFPFVVSAHSDYSRTFEKKYKNNNYDLEDLFFNSDNKEYKSIKKSVNKQKKEIKKIKKLLDKANNKDLVLSKRIKAIEDLNKKLHKKSNKKNKRNYSLIKY